MGILNGVLTQDEISSGGVQYALIARMKDIKITFVENDGATASTATYTLADGSAITPVNTPFTTLVALIMKVVSTALKLTNAESCCLADK